MVVVENVVGRSELFGNENNWEEEGIFGTGKCDEMNNIYVEVGAKDDWEDEGIFYSCTAHNDEDESVCDDDLKSVVEDDWEDEGIFIASR
eukprot:3671024-Ditylum_brightwellii.AAC.1